jgi:hypothetical protein
VELDAGLMIGRLGESRACVVVSLWWRFDDAAGNKVSALYRALKRLLRGCAVGVPRVKSEGKQRGLAVTDFHTERLPKRARVIAQATLNLQW